MIETTECIALCDVLRQQKHCAQERVDVIRAAEEGRQRDALHVAEALEQETTRALAGDDKLMKDFGPLVAVNSAEHFSIKRIGRKRTEHSGLIEVDGLVVGAHGIALLNSAKHSPSLKHVEEVFADASELQQMLSHLDSVTTDPISVKQQLINISCVLPFICGNEFSALVAASCSEKGVGILRPSGEGFVVEALPRVSLTVTPLTVLGEPQPDGPPNQTWSL